MASKLAKVVKSSKRPRGRRATKKLKNIGADKLTAEQKYFLHRRVRILAYSADKMVDELKALKQEEQNDDAKSASALLKTAAYGQPTGKTPTPTTEKMFGTGATGNIRSCCENTENQIRTTTLAAVQICLCAAGPTLKDVCVNPTPAHGQWGDGTTSGPTRWEALAEHCESKASTEKPEELLDTALGALIASLRKSGSDRYLGAYRATGCQATQATGFCIKLTGDSQADPKVLNSFPWVFNIRKVIAALRRSRKATERAKLLKANLQTLAEQLKVEVDAAKTVIAQPTATKNAPSPAVGVNSEQAEECKQHKPKMVFEEKSCQWKGKNETEGTCKPKYGEGQKTKGKDGAEAATNTEGKKCSEKKTEGECKDGCKWDGKICKDSSFLVNTKLELSMAATFTVLVAFYHSNDFSEFTPLVKCLKN